jgi:hypothetical protein
VVLQLRQLVQHRHQHLPLQQPLTAMPTLTTSATGTDRIARTRHGQHLDTDETLAVIADLANSLCDHLADYQWATADYIRTLAETARTNSTSNGAS